MTIFAGNPNNADLAYMNIRAAENAYTQDGRQHCEDLWRDFEPLADRNFLTEFPLRFHQRWFEMYTGVALIRHGLQVESGSKGPDLLISHDGTRIWVECVCATAGQEGHPDTVLEPQEGAGWVPHDAIALRIRSSLEEKAKKYRGYLDNGAVGPDDLLVVALNVRSVPHAWLDLEENLMRAIYGRGDLVVRLDRETYKIVGEHYQHKAFIPKVGTGAEIGVRPFIDGSLGHIAGVLGSSADACNRTVRLGDDFNFMPNVTADHQWPGGIIQLGQEWTFDEVGDEWRGSRRSYLQEPSRAYT